MARKITIETQALTPGYLRAQGAKLLFKLGKSKRIAVVLTQNESDGKLIATMREISSSYETLRSLRHRVNLHTSVAVHPKNTSVIITLPNDLLASMDNTELQDFIHEQAEAIIEYLTTNRSILLDDIRVICAKPKRLMKIEN